MAEITGRQGGTRAHTHARTYTRTHAHGANTDTQKEEEVIKYGTKKNICIYLITEETSVKKHKL